MKVSGRVGRGAALREINLILCDALAGWLAAWMVGRMVGRPISIVFQARNEEGMNYTAKDNDTTMALNSRYPLLGR